MEEGEIAFKCNFACLDDFGEKVISRRADKNFSDCAKLLCDFLQAEFDKTGSWFENEGIEITIKHATEHRCGIKIGKKGIKLSSNISGTDPLIDG
jgi:2,3-bisphosphoglycerate-independent phosphoglycerate mutase